jgi:8-oxo-dGTP pyrophosphatase MutT (NUDIX family)
MPEATSRPEAGALAAGALAAVRAHPDLARLADALAARPGVRAVVDPRDPEPRRAAVALVFRLGADATPELLFVKRAEYPGDPWSGHVAFPGGRREPGDRDAWDTAARETWEETGLDLRRSGALLGTLDDLYPRNPALPNVVVRPHVAVAAPSSALALSDEVAAAFWVPVGRLTDPDAARSSVVQARGRSLVVPSFVHEGHTIWGMTHRILTQLLERFAGSTSG